jgi:hypothetical protein
MTTQTQAHGMVSWAVEKGVLIRKSCEICGSETNVHAHHDDYSEPLKIRWLCHNHHFEYHKNERQKKATNSKPVEQQNNFYTKEEAAKALGITIRRLTDLTEPKGDIIAYKKKYGGRRVYYLKKDIDELRQLERVG